MEINSIIPFLEYYKRIHQRTLRVIKCIPRDKIEWTHKEGAFTLGDQIRHLASINRYMFAENVQYKPSSYPGHDKSLTNGYDYVMNYYQKCHDELMEIISKLQDEDLQKTCIIPGGTSITVWKWLRAMIEHEIHHRGQIYLHLNFLGIPTPPLYGLTSEEVKKKSI